MKHGGKLEDKFSIAAKRSRKQEGLARPGNQIKMVRAIIFPIAYQP